MGWQIYPWPSWLELDPYNASAFGAALRARLTPFLTRMQAENGAPPTHRRRGVHQSLACICSRFMAHLEQCILSAVSAVSSFGNRAVHLLQLQHAS